MKISSTGPLQASIIIPTHNRRAILLNSLQALNQQSIAHTAFEVIVVADGCTDDTIEAVQSFQANYDLFVLSQPKAGPSAARNLGSASGRGSILIFLDDDIEADPLFVAAHLEAHHHRKRSVVIGYCPPLLKTQVGYFKTELRGWWQTMFTRMNHPGYRFAYSDLISGNFSLEPSLFAEVGKFNPAFVCHEDYELGMRLIQAGAKLVFSSTARGYHYENTDLLRALTRKRAEGKADVILGKLYPALRPVTLMSNLDLYARLPTRFLKHLAFRAPPLGNYLIRKFIVMLDTFERFRWYRLWQRVLYGLMAYSYWQGVADEMGSFKSQQSFLSKKNESGLEEILDLNLDKGLKNAKLWLDQHRPAGIRLWYAKHYAGAILPAPGRENLCGDHLESIFQDDRVAPLLQALVRSGELGDPKLSAHLIHISDQRISFTQSMNEHAYE